MLKVFLRKVREWLLNLAAIFFFGLIIAVFVCVILYPAFFWMFMVTIMLTTVTCVYWGHAPIDFPGMGILPYWGLALGIYLATFASLRYLHFKGEFAFEVQWLALGATALVASLITFFVCLAINRPKK